jgi:hypothetical protein
VEEKKTLITGSQDRETMELRTNEKNWRSISYLRQLR